MIAQYFLENLRSLIEARGLNQARFAKEIESSQSTVNGWYVRQSLPNTETIEKIAVYFNVEPAYFFMKPGTQGEVKPTERDDSFKVFLDRRASEILSEKDLNAYHIQGGAAQFVKQMVENYETPKLAIQDWYQLLAAEVARYAGIDLVEKVRKMYRKDTVKKSESA